MRLGFKRGEKGFTLIEIIIVLAVMAVLAAVVVPNVTGFLGRGKERSWNADQGILQAAVDSWRTDISNRVGNSWPTVGGVKGALADSGADGVDIGTDSTVIKVSDLVTDNYIKSTDAVKSFAFSTGTGSGATNSPVGSYVWYIDTNGLVQGQSWTDTTTAAGIVNLAELSGSDGFTTDVYP